MPKQSAIADLAALITKFKPLVTEKEGFTGKFAPRDPKYDMTRDELLVLIGHAVRELHSYISENEQVKEQYMVLIEKTSDAHALLNVLGFRDMPLFESVQVLHDKYRQLLDVMIKLSSHNGTGEQLRAIAEESLLFFGPSSLCCPEEGEKSTAGDAKA